jgi:hypothetical protein
VKQKTTAISKMENERTSCLARLMESPRVPRAAPTSGAGDGRDAVVRPRKEAGHADPAKRLSEARRITAKRPNVRRASSAESQPGGNRGGGYRFNLNFSHFGALEYQERLFQEAAARLRRKQQQANNGGDGDQQYYRDHVLPSTRNSLGIPTLRSRCSRWRVASPCTGRGPGTRTPC